MQVNVCIEMVTEAGKVPVAPSEYAAGGVPLSLQNVSTLTLPPSPTWRKLPLKFSSKLTTAAKFLFN